MYKPLFDTKLHIPTRHAHLIQRPRLIELLDHGCHSKMTIISTPTGYGKTTLLCQWLSCCSFPIAWLTLDRADNDPIRFLLYLAAALQRIDPNVDIDMLDALQSTAVSSGGNASSLLPLTTELINDISKIQSPFFLVLDDYHHIESERVHNIISYILENQPVPLHMVIATQVDPPLPVARLRAQGQLVELRAIDLRFTPREASTFLNDVMNLALTQEQVNALVKRTEGWVAGLQLAGISMQAHEDKTAFIEAFTGSHHYIMDYLLEEVLNHQNDLLREFLLRTSILERMTGNLCNALTGRSDGPEVLDRLEQNNLFVIPLDDQRQWYRYHHLFADVLQSRLQQFHPEIMLELHRKASEWFTANGFLEDAIFHSVSGKDLENAAGLIEQNAMAMLKHGELVTLLNWIKPVEVLSEDRPWLGIYKSWALALTGQLDAAEIWLCKAERAIQRANQNSRSEMQGHIEAICAYNAEARGDADLTISHATKALQLLSENNQAVRSVVMFTLATAYRLIGDHGKAIKTLINSRQSSHRSGNSYLELGAVFTLADITFDQGRLHQAFDIYKEMLLLATKSSGQELPAAGMAYIGLGLVHYQWNELDIAEVNIQKAIELCQRWGHFVNLAGSLAMLSRLKQAQGDLDSAQQAIQKAEELNRKYALALRVKSWVTAIRVRLWLAQGNLEAATSWAKESGITIADEFSYLREVEYLTLVHVYLANEEYDQVLELSQWLQNATEKTDRIGNLIEALILRSLAFQAENDFARALESLRKALYQWWNYCAEPQVRA
jgi:LuxR family maltose regulon positive regulatory protein